MPAGERVCSRGSRIMVAVMVAAGIACAAGAPRPAAAAVSRATEVTGGADHACTLHFGEVHCWGDNEFGQLGNGTTTTQSDVPVTVLHPHG